MRNRHLFRIAVVFIVFLPGFCQAAIPADLATKSEDLAISLGLKYNILDEEIAQEMGLNAYLSVAQGSDQPAKFIDTQQHAEEHLARGNYLMQNGELEEAIIAYSRALELNSDLHEALFNRGLARGRHGDLDAAIADLSKYIQIYPDSSLAYTKRWKGDIHGAYRDYLKAIKLDGSNAEAHDDIGVIYAQWGQLGKALISFKVATRLDPGYQKAYHNLALTHYLREEVQLALEAINKSLELKPDAKASLLLKSEILERLGKHEQAQKLRQYAEQLPDANWTEEFDG